ncbi:hypothetical protein SAMN05444166_4308 [Singulisphaera sp. GP187]|nr:hypothetical protein SAMN05444166_4308 [Singulisphaera sp. GP187]
MRSRALFALLLTLAGCGGPEAPITDPSQVPPLTAEQLETIKQNDRQVEEEEGGPFLKRKTKYEARAKRRG